MILLVLICIIFFFRIIKCTPQGAFVASGPARPFLRPRSSPSVHAIPRQVRNLTFVRAPAPSAKKKPSVVERMTSRSHSAASAGPPLPPPTTLPTALLECGRDRQPKLRTCVKQRYCIHVVYYIFNLNQFFYSDKFHAAVFFELPRLKSRPATSSHRGHTHPYG